MKRVTGAKESRVVRPALAVVVLVLAAAVLTAGAFAANQRGAVVKVGKSSFGRIIVDSHGRTLYLWAHDKRRKSTCYGECARDWPPLTTHGKPRAISGARGALLGTTRRTDRRTQVTYHGHPLYYFEGDRRAGQTAGAGLTAFGGRWDPVSTAGTAVRKRAMSSRKASKFKHPKLKHGVLTVEGTKASDRIALRLQAGKPGILQIDVGDNGSADFNFERKQIAKIAVKARGGDDRVRVDELNGVFTDSAATTIDGGDGNDNLAGGSGAETLLGGAGNDSLDGNRGNDLALLGAGDDTFVWDPGDGSDTVEGQDGADRMLFNGAGIAEKVELTANGNRLRFVRDIAGITMDTAGVERVDFNALGGADLVTVNDLAGTGVNAVNVDLGGDGDKDHIVVNGSNGDDTIKVKADASAVTVSGLTALVSIQHQESTDELVVDGLGGNDDISAAALAAQAITLTFDGDTGDDSIFGGQGNDTLLGGDGNDSLDGSKGNDLALMGAGDDMFFWDPGDGSDTVEGQDGADTMFFIGANIAEEVDVSANGNRVRFSRNVGNVTMDTAGVERIDFEALAGADLVTVNDLTGSDLTSLNIDLEGVPGVGEGDPDRIVVNATDGDDAIDVSGNAEVVKVSGLAPTIKILHPEVANDRLEIDTLAGSDTVDSEALAPGAIQLLVDGIVVP